MIANVEVIHGPNWLRNISRSQASIHKAVQLLIKPTHNFERGLKNAVECYWEPFKR